MAKKNFLILLVFFLSFGTVFLSLLAWTDRCSIMWRRSDNIALQLEKIECLFEVGKYQLVKKEMMKVEKTSPLWEEQLESYERRLRASDFGLRRQEISFWKQRLVKNPFYPDAWVSLALLWYQQGDWQKAKMAMRKSCFLDPVRKDINRIATQIGWPCR